MNRFDCDNLLIRKINKTKEEKIREEVKNAKKAGLCVFLRFPSLQNHGMSLPSKERKSERERE